MLIEWHGLSVSRLILSTSRRPGFNPVAKIASFGEIVSPVASVTSGLPDSVVIAATFVAMCGTLAGICCLTAFTRS
jgi:hypothetical protein